MATVWGGIDPLGDGARFGGGTGSVAPSPQAPAKAKMAATARKRPRLEGIELDGFSERERDW